jgi:serine/threonine protein kinase
VFESDYTNACDIWLLGVIIFEYIYGLPKRKGDRGRRWCQRILHALDDWEDDLTDILSTAMLIMNPKERLPADECYTKAVWLMTQPHSLVASSHPSSQISGDIKSKSNACLRNSNASTFIEPQTTILRTMQPGTQSQQWCPNLVFLLPFKDDIENPDCPGLLLTLTAASVEADAGIQMGVFDCYALQPSFSDILDVLGA